MDAPSLLGRWTVLVRAVKARMSAIGVSEKVYNQVGLTV
ncbi:hypothetical protein BDIM_22210 [Brevundimonas diminuta ATCC 11568]|nr:hypothetical protein BDIM_22210 [Brevundimonas diminuta ATCC 11568]